MDDLDVPNPEGCPGVVRLLLQEGVQLRKPGLPQLLGGPPVLEDGQIDVPVRQVRLQGYRTVHECLHLQIVRPF